MGLFIHEVGKMVNVPSGLSAAAARATRSSRWPSTRSRRRGPPLRAVGVTTKKQAGFGGQTKPIFRKKAKTTKKIVLRMECATCKHKRQVAIKRCKHFELGGDKRRKGVMI